MSAAMPATVHPAVAASMSIGEGAADRQGGRRESDEDHALGLSHEDLLSLRRTAGAVRSMARSMRVGCLTFDTAAAPAFRPDRLSDAPDKRSADAGSLGLVRQ
jgi:hypothetical protein